MSEITIFKNSEFGEVRTLTINGEPWFVGKDVSSILGYERATKAIRDHVDTDDTDEIPIQDSIGRMQNTPIINESGLYSLILSSKLPTAKNFKRWVTSEVLPTIRKTGGYVNNADSFINNYLPFADEQTKLLFKSTLSVIDNLNQKIENDKPLVDFANQVADTSDLIDIGDMAKLLKDENIDIGRNRLFTWLKNKNILMERNVPYQRYINDGYFKVKEITMQTPYGTKIYPKTYVTGKGQIYITQKIKDEFVTIKM